MNRSSQRAVMGPEAFKVLPPLSPELPAPPRAPQPHRVAAPVSRREKTAFVILHDQRPPPSRGASPSGRVSPFRGRGFREETSRHASREPSPGPEESRGNVPRSRSRSRLPVATPRSQLSTSTSNSPVRNGGTAIPKPIIRRNSVSPNRATKVLNQVNRNKGLTSPTHQGRTSYRPPASPRHESKTIMSPKRVGPANNNRSVNPVSNKPPLPRSNQGAQKENEKKPLPSPHRKPRPPPSKPDVTRSPSRIPRTRSISRGRGGNVRPTSPSRSPVRAVIRQSNKMPLKKANSDKNLTNGQKKSGNNGEKKNGVNGEKNNGVNGEKNNGINGEKKNGVNGETTDGSKVSNMSPKPVERKKEEREKTDMDIPTKIPPPVEAVVSTVSVGDEKSPEPEKKEVHETPVEVKPQPPPVESPPPSKSSSVEETKKPSDNGKSDAPEPPKVNTEALNPEPLPEPTTTLVRTTTAPALELAQPDVIPTILAKGEQEISKSISEGPSVEDKCENPGDPRETTLASVESVRSTTSVETVRAAAKDGEVLNANNLMKTDGNGRNIAWDKSPEVSPMNNSVHPTTLPLQPKKQGCCGRLFCKPESCCQRLGTRLGSLCGKLNCCAKSSCCKKKEGQQPPAQPARAKKSRLRDCLSRLNCFRWSKCCKRGQQQQQQLRPTDEDEEPTPGCCARCGQRGRRCYSALFCLDRACCQRLRNRCRCSRFGCCGIGGCCGPSPPQLDRRKSRMSVRKSQTSITQGLPKLDPTLVEHQSEMRAAVPVLPLPLAWLCCILNVFLPGTGTLFSGMFCLCFGKPRFSVNDSYPSRLGAFCINIVVAVSQLFTVLFCLVGWGWSIWWGVMMVKFAKKQKRILLAEKHAEQTTAAPVVVNQNHDVERAAPR